MRKTLITLMMLTMAVIAAISQPRCVEGLSSTQRVLGYTLTDDIDIYGAGFGQAGTYTVGAALGAEVLKLYAGCRVVGIRIAAAMNLGRQRTFMYDVSNNFTLLVEQKQRLYDGWNNVFFNGDGYVINGTETLFFGHRRCFGNVSGTSCDPLISYPGKLFIGIHSDIYRYYLNRIPLCHSSHGAFSFSQKSRHGSRNRPVSLGHTFFNDTVIRTHDDERFF